ncbi:hypothetical protein PT974_02138 [Cladobotryum mycophilum]|uniref:Hydrolase n=1 Tax=Cladobotryum mycophilum TaxID=491253 RepID=A0ABR0SYG3_9HYPO
MDLDAAEMPPIPSRTHQLHHHSHSQSQSQSYSRRHHQATSSSSRRPNIPPASPEVITNLITSLSVLPSPTTRTHFDTHLRTSSLSLPTSPNPGTSPLVSPIARNSGSFGLEYRSYSQSYYNHSAERDDSLDEAASPPVVRTSKAPSGYSSLTASGSPRKQRSSSRDSIGLKSFIRSSSTTTSRPSSRGSFTSKNDDTQSIGNLSIERGSAPTPDLKPRRSVDSWGKRASRGSKSLIYMNSKERLRDTDKKRGSGQATPVGPSSIHSGGRADPFLAENAISESFTRIDSPVITENPRPIPARESSLRKTSASSRKRSGAHRPKRDSTGTLGDAILEAPESFRPLDTANMHRRIDSDAGKTFLYDVDENSSSQNRTSSVYEAELFREEDVVYFEDDGAPFPSVSQGRRRDDLLSDRSSSRLSGRMSPGPNEITQPKRSGSRLKRLSAGLSSPIDRRSSDEPSRMPSGYERPKSADSVDDAVESYLCSPRLSQKIKHPQTGRVISFSEVGDSEGSAVFCCVGMGLTRYITAFYDELALTLKLRLITPDRPGVGDSEPYVDGTTTPLSWPDDVFAYASAHSGRIHLLAPWIPPSQMNVFGTSQVQPPSNSLPTSQRILRALPTPILKAANSSFMSATSTSITSSLPKNPRRAKRKSNGKDAITLASRNVTPNLDKENFNSLNGKNGVLNGDGLMEPNATENMDRMHRPDGPVTGESTGLGTMIDSEADKERQQTYDIRLTHAIWELATTNANPAVDLLVCLERQHTIGFRYVDITRPVVIHHGSKDNRVPVENVKWLGRAMRRCEVRVLEQEGHGLMASATVMGSVLMEISKEWEDWIRATGADGRKERERVRRGTIGRVS